MKFAAAMSILAVSQTQAQTNGNVTHPDGRKFSHIVNMAYTQITTSHSSKDISKMIQNYGCHCFPGLSKIAGGQGPAQDGIDNLCRELARCHKCVEMDYGNMIDSNTEKYRWDLMVDGSINCARNTIPEKRDLCMCDANYSMKLGAVWTDAAFDYTIWMNRKNSLANFDFENICVNGGGVPSDSCCGTYPDRQPLNTVTKMCCNDSQVYSDMTEECCSDGSVKAIGSC